MQHRSFHMLENTNYNIISFAPIHIYHTWHQDSKAWEVSSSVVVAVERDYDRVKIGIGSISRRVKMESRTKTLVNNQIQGSTNCHHLLLCFLALSFPCLVTQTSIDQSWQQFFSYPRSFSSRSWAGSPQSMSWALSWRAKRSSAWGPAHCTHIDSSTGNILRCYHCNWMTSWKTSNLLHVSRDSKLVRGVRKRPNLATIMSTAPAIHHSLKRPKRISKKEQRYWHPTIYSEGGNGSLTTAAKILLWHFCCSHSRNSKVLPLTPKTLVMFLTTFLTFWKLTRAKYRDFRDYEAYT